MDRQAGTVTAASVSFDTGLGVDECEDELRSILVRCGGDFEMTGEAEGESVRYKFQPNLRSRVAKVEEKEALLQGILSAFACLKWGLQAFFGLMLLLSLAIIILAAAAVITAVS